ncbi:MAG TPA: MBL fold metallo-hydrolase [Spirochaetes bacterium]|nr:MBL fold metallo-hydrolase [Spirochaetota bacterium]
MGEEINNSSDTISEDPKIHVRYYGVRGSIPTPLKPVEIEQKCKRIIAEIIKNDKFRGQKLREIFNAVPIHLKSTYGGNTPCVLVKTAGHTIIIDAGSGIRNLGIDLMQQEFGQGKGKAIFLFSHTHWDHIQGLPFFTPLFIPGNQFEFYSCFPDLKERLKGQQDSRYFPIGMDYMQAEKQFFLLKSNESKDFGKFTIKTIKLDHPGSAYGYKIEIDGKSFLYSSDLEFNEKNYDTMPEIIEFFKGADVLTFDSQYTLAESFTKIDWGHSSIQIGIDIANHSGIKKIVLFHYDPTYSDQKINEITEIGLSYKKAIYPGSDLEVIPSYEGLELEI